MPEAAAVPFSPPGIFSRLFPVPKFLKMPAAGLEISDAVLRAVVLEREKNGARVARKGTRLLPEGVIRMGDVMKKDVLIRELREFKKEMNLDFVHATVPDEKAYLFKVQIPKVSEDEIRPSVEFTLDENIPIPPSEVVFEYAEIFRPTHIGPEHMDVSVSALPHDILSEHVSVLHEAGLEPLSFYTPSEALRQAFVRPGDRKTYLFLHIGLGKTTIAVAAEGVIRYSTTITVGSDTLISSVMRSFSVSREDAEKMMREKSFFKSGENAEFYAALLGGVSVISDEARKVMAYWDNHTRKTNETDQRIEKVFLSGMHATLRGFDEYLSAAMRELSEPGNAWTNIFQMGKATPALSLSDSLEYAVPIGLASFDFFS